MLVTFGTDSPLLGRAGGERDVADRAVTGRADPGHGDRGTGPELGHDAGQALRGADGLPVHGGDDGSGRHARGRGRTAADRPEDQGPRADVGDVLRGDQVAVAGVAALVAVPAEAPEAAEAVAAVLLSGLG